MNVGAYAVLEPISQGGMGIVFKARAPDGRLVAVKVLKKAAKAAFERFERERRLLKELLDERGFVPILDSGESDQGPFLVMPFVEGGTLRARIALGALPVDEALALGRALAATM